MPRVCAFYGIVITMYWRDHPPPHSMRPEWASVHQDELRGNWDRAGAHEPLLPIDPLP
jgi:hypothetical protein